MLSFFKLFSKNKAPSKPKSSPPSAAVIEKFYALLQQHKDAFNDLVAGYDRELTSVLEHLCLAKALGTSYSIVFSGEFNTTKELIVNKCIQTWKDMNTTDGGAQLATKTIDITGFRKQGSVMINTMFGMEIALWYLQNYQDATEEIHASVANALQVRRPLIVIEIDKMPENWECLSGVPVSGCVHIGPPSNTKHLETSMLVAWSKRAVRLKLSNEIDDDDLTKIMSDLANSDASYKRMEYWAEYLEDARKAHAAKSEKDKKDRGSSPAAKSDANTTSTVGDGNSIYSLGSSVGDGNSIQGGLGNEVSIDSHHTVAKLELPRIMARDVPEGYKPLISQPKPLPAEYLTTPKSTRYMKRVRDFVATAASFAPVATLIPDSTVQSAAKGLTKLAEAIETEEQRREKKAEKGKRKKDDSGEEDGGQTKKAKDEK